MKHFYLIVLGSVSILVVSAQDLPPVTQQQLEDLIEERETEGEEDEQLLQVWEDYKKHPLRINFATEDMLSSLQLLSPLQIYDFITYRRIFGKIISVYELQAIPSWDEALIKKIMPFISVDTVELIGAVLAAAWKDGEHTLLWRVSRLLETPAGFDEGITGSRYLGSPYRYYFRYRYNSRNKLQYGLVADKDAGEQFFKGAQKRGFDFYSFHFFLRNTGRIKALAIGDFTVNMGQGLIHWQSLAFKKSADATAIRRQSAVLRPYHSAGEYFFTRGVGITWQHKQWNITGFAARKNVSANIETGEEGSFFTSFNQLGYHRTVTEVAGRKAVEQYSYGTTVKLLGKKGHVAVNMVGYQFSMPYHKRNAMYNLFAINDNDWQNMSIDYSRVIKNAHFFGEVAIDKQGGHALVTGVQLSADRKIDMAWLFRSISKTYQAVQGNAFTKAASPGNENGLYWGVTWRPSFIWRVDGYADIYSFPWLKYLVDAPSKGKDYLLQVSYSPSKKINGILRYRQDLRQQNEANNITAYNFLENKLRQSLRIQWRWRLQDEIVLQQRQEMIWYDKKGTTPSLGYLLNIDVVYKPLRLPFSATTRLQYVETDDYNSRIYAYEQDVLYSYSIPVFYDKGFRYYLLLSAKMGRHWTVWVRVAQTYLPDRAAIGSGLAQITGGRRTEIKLQLRYLLN